MLPVPGYLDRVVGDIKRPQELYLGYRAQEFFTVYQDRFLEAYRKSATVLFKSLLPYKLASFQNWDDGQLCHGDSGGPIFHQGDDGEEWIVGVLCGGVGGDRWGCKADSTHYRIDTISAQNWINDDIDLYMNGQ